MRPNVSSSPAFASSATFTLNVMISFVPAMFASATPVSSQHTMIFVLFSNEYSPALIFAFVSAFTTPEPSTYSRPSGRSSSNCQPAVNAPSTPVTLTVISTSSPATTSVLLASKSNVKSGSTTTLSVAMFNSTFSSARSLPSPSITRKSMRPNVSSSPAFTSSATFTLNVMISFVPAIFASATPVSSQHTMIFVLFSNENSPALIFVFVSAFTTPEPSTYSRPSGRSSSNCQPAESASAVPVTLSVTVTSSPALTSALSATKSNTKSTSFVAIAASGIILKSINALKAIAKNFFIVFPPIKAHTVQKDCSFWTIGIIYKITIRR